MDHLALIAQIIIALGICNVWLLRTGRPSIWRAGTAATMQQEFAVYGLPSWAMQAVGAIKLMLAAALIAGLWFPALVQPAAMGMAFMMLAAVLMHFKVGDPVLRSVPATTMLLLSLFVVSIV